MLSVSRCYINFTAIKLQYYENLDSRHFLELFTKSTFHTTIMWYTTNNMMIEASFLAKKQKQRLFIHNLNNEDLSSPSSRKLSRTEPITSLMTLYKKKHLSFNKISLINHTFIGLFHQNKLHCTQGTFSFDLSMVF